MKKRIRMEVTGTNDEVLLNMRCDNWEMIKDMLCVYITTEDHVIVRTIVVPLHNIKMIDVSWIEEV